MNQLRLEMRSLLQVRTAWRCSGRKRTYDLLALHGVSGLDKGHSTRKLGDGRNNT